MGGGSPVVALLRVAARTELAISATPRAASKYHSAGSAAAAHLRCICATRIGPCAVQQRCGPYAHAAVRAERGSAVRGSPEPAGGAACGGMGSGSRAPACADTTVVRKEARCNHQCSRGKRNTELWRRVGGGSSAELTFSGVEAAEVRLRALARATARGVRVLAHCAAPLTVAPASCVSMRKSGSNGLRVANATSLHGLP